MGKANFYKKLETNNIQCRLCNHFCRIAEGAVGVCGARQNFSGELVSLVYGKPAAMNVDPVEKKPLYHFLPGTFTYSLGTLGCNMRCLACHNYSISQVRDSEAQSRAIFFVEPKEIVRRAISSACESISYTYNEPTIFVEYALDIMKLAREEGLKNIWVTNGYMSSESLTEIIPLLDAVNIDIKAGDKSFYRKLCGADMEPVLENSRRLKKAGVHTEITTLMIPGLDNRQLEFIARFIADELGADTPWHISRFSPSMSWRLKDFEATSRISLDRAYEIGKRAGLVNVYLGNI